MRQGPKSRALAKITSSVLVLWLHLSTCRLDINCHVLNTMILEISRIGSIYVLSYESQSAQVITSIFKATGKPRLAEIKAQIKQIFEKKLYPTLIWTNKNLL